MDIYRRYGPALLRKATRLLGNRDDALDVVQGLFTDLYARSALDVELPYLYRALTNRCLTMIRDRNTHTRLLERETPALRGVVPAPFFAGHREAPHECRRTRHALVDLAVPFGRGQQ